MRAFAVALLCLSPASFAARPFTPEELLQTRRLDDVQVSPDGKWVSFTVRQKSLAENRDLKDVWVIALAGGTARPLTRDGKSEHGRWSPDGRQVLITSSRSGEAQQWVFDVALGAAGVLAGGDPRQITALLGGGDAGVWSPDGKLIAFASDVYPQCNGDDSCNRRRADERDAGKVKAQVIDHLFARHWVEWKDGKRTHLFVQPAAGGPARDLTPGDSDWPSWRLGFGDDFAFSPDGSELCVSHKAAEREAWSTNGDLFLIPVAGGAAKNLTKDNPGDDAQPRWSPDGRYLAWLAQAKDGVESDQWKLKLLDRRSGKVQVVGDFDDDVGAFAWRRDGKGLVAGVISKGRLYLNSVSLEGKVARFAPAQAGGDFDLAPDGSAAVISGGMNRPPELNRAAPGADKLVHLSSFNQEQYAGLDLGPAPEELWVEGRDGAKVHAWILKPPGLLQGQRAPLVVLIHGGPQGAWEDNWGMRWNPAVFAARGAVVVMPNPRGSFGYGHKFEEQINNDWGGLAYDDLLRVTDAAEKLPFVEPGRTCAAGASYGGYLIDWIAGHTDRYRCLVSHDGVFDLRSLYGATEELWFPEGEFGGPYWENPQGYEKWSPSSYVKNFKTPTLVVQGELDFRVPTEQGLGMFTALQRRGVESRMLWFPDEGHWVNKPRNSQLWYHTVLDWIDAHAKGKPAR